MKTAFTACAVLLSLLCFQGAEARGLGPIATPKQGGFQVKFASNGQPMANLSSVPGAVQASGTARIALSPSTVIEAAATGAITGSAMAGPWGAAIAAVGAVAIVAIPAFYDAYQRAAISVGPDGTMNTVSASSKCDINNVSPDAKRPTQFCQNNGAVSGALIWSTPYAGRCQATIRCTRSNATFFDVDAGQTNESLPGTPSPITPAEAIALLTLHTPTEAEVQAMVDLNFPPEVAPTAITGPASVYMGNTVQLGVDGSKTVIEETAKISYFPDSVKVDLQKTFKTTTPGKTETTTETEVRTNPDGTTQTQQVTRTISTPEREVTGTVSTEKGDPTTCGLPGGSPCKIDETGTAEPVPETKYVQKLDPPKAEQAILRDKAAGSSDKSFFSDWGSVFITPPLATCSAFVLPRDMGSLDPCPVVDGVRAVMAYLWALGALWICLGWIREVV